MPDFANLAGKIIMFDGPDNVGKTTQLNLVEAELSKTDLDIVRTRVAGGTPIGELLRQVSFSDEFRPPETDLHIALAQYYAVAGEIRKWKASGQTILVDRSPLSLLSYQVYGSGLDQVVGLKATDTSMKIFQPSVVIVYSASLKTILERSKTHKHVGSDYFGNKPSDYFRRVIEGYEVGAKRYKELVVLVDAEPGIEVIHTATMEALSQL